MPIRKKKIQLCTLRQYSFYHYNCKINIKIRDLTIFNIIGKHKGFYDKKVSDIIIH